MSRELRQDMTHERESTESSRAPNDARELRKELLKTLSESLEQTFSDRLERKMRDYVKESLANQPKQRQMQEELNSLREEVGNLRVQVFELQRATGSARPPSANGEMSRPRSRNCCAFDGPVVPKLTVPPSSNREEGKFLFSPLNNAKISSMVGHHDANTLTPEYRDILEDATEEHDVQLDSWGAAILVVVRDLPHLLAKDIRQETLLRLVVVSIVLVLNNYLQFMFMYWITEKVLLERLSSLQYTYKTYHRIAFTPDGFSQQDFESLGDKRDLICELPITTFFYMCSCVFIWALRCAKEFQDIQSRRKHLLHLPTLPPDMPLERMTIDMTPKDSPPAEYRKRAIVCLSKATRLRLLVLVFMPQYLIALCLLLLGSTFLTASRSFEELILNSLIMSFILDIDELLFHACLPKRIKSTLINLSIRSPPDEHEGQYETDVDTKKRARMKAQYARSCCFFCMTWAFVLLWYWFQPVIPGYAYDIADPCASYLSAVRHVPCAPWEKGCFPKSNGTAS